MAKISYGWLPFLQYCENKLKLGKIKTCNFSKNEHILHKENNIVKDLMITFFIHIEFTKILGQFKQTKKCKFIHDIIFWMFFKHLIFNSLKSQ